VSPEHLAAFQKTVFSLPAIKRYCIAYSGGRDSHVLLHLAAQFIPTSQLLAIHIHHGLHPAANQWIIHCQSICQSFKIEFITQSIAKQLHTPSFVKQQGGLEAAARKARYKALVHHLQSQDCLLTAHHQQDQAETLLLQLFRGAGIKGLAAMPVLSQCDTIPHLRPLLHWNQTDLEAYTRVFQLQWIKDDSNDHLRFSRNLIRHQVLPLLQTRWPAIIPTLSRTTQHCAEANTLLRETAEQDFQQCLGRVVAKQVSGEKSRRIGDEKRSLLAVNEYRKPQSNNEFEPETLFRNSSGEKPRSLSIYALNQLTPARCHNVLRYWLQKTVAISPSTVQLKHIRQLLQVSTTRTNAHIQLGTVQLRSYHKHLLLHTVPTTSAEPREAICWNWQQAPLSIPTVGKLSAHPAIGRGIRLSTLIHPFLVIRFREGGERFHPQGRLGSRPLKKLFQEWEVPPWERHRIPLIYYEKQLIAVTGYAISKAFAAKPTESGLHITIERHDSA
jgi:tRNA(Ile)-lysidine synthase